MFDAHAHPGIPRNNALVCTATTKEQDLLSSFSYPSLGLLPGKDGQVEKIELWAKSNKFIGEVGIDRRYEDKEKQIKIFRSILDIAVENHNFVSIHAVGWTGDLIKILREYKGINFLIHNYIGSIETAKEILNLGGFISLSPRAEKNKHFSSLITFLPYFLTESDMKTGEEEERILSEWNKRLSKLLNRDIEREVEKIMAQS